MRVHLLRNFTNPDLTLIMPQTHLNKNRPLFSLFGFLCLGRSCFVAYIHFVPNPWGRSRLLVHGDWFDSAGVTQNNPEETAGDSE
jgi:hypothetical protein